ncbi:hypothetical protein RYX36_018667 [Vicia faba]
MFHHQFQFKTNNRKNSDTDMKKRDFVNPIPTNATTQPPGKHGGTRITAETSQIQVHMNNMTNLRKRQERDPKQRPNNNDNFKLKKAGR